MGSKRIVSQISVEPPGVSTNNYQCAAKSCFQVSAKRCKGCKSIIYCSRICQEAHWGKHKAICKKIKKWSVEVVKEVEVARNYEDFDGSRKNLFDGHVGEFWGLFEPRDYCRARFFVADGMLECAMKNNSTLALQMALEHLLDLVWLTRSDNLGCRYMIPSILISLGRMQDAYDFMKWWAVAGSDMHYDWGDIELPFLDLKGEDMTEPLKEVQVDKHTNAQTLLELLMIKLDIRVEMKELTDDASKEVFSKVDSQVKSLIGLINEANENLFELLEERSELTDADKPESYSRGSVEEAYHIVFNSRLAWDKFSKAMSAVFK